MEDTYEILPVRLRCRRIDSWRSAGNGGFDQRLVIGHVDQWLGENGHKLFGRKRGFVGNGRIVREQPRRIKRFSRP